MDYLPIQASAVPCERLFSSGKETTTARRNRLTAELMEALQLLKFHLKKSRLTFTDGWVCNEAELNNTPISGVPEGLDGLTEVLNLSEGTPLNNTLATITGDVGVEDLSLSME